MKPAKLPTDWITVQEAADHLGVHHDTIYDGCKTGGLRHAKIGQGRGTIRMRRAWVDEWAEGLSVTVDTGRTKSPATERRPFEPVENHQKH